LFNSFNLCRVTFGIVETHCQGAGPGGWGEGAAHPTALSAALSAEPHQKNNTDGLGNAIKKMNGTGKAPKYKMVQKMRQKYRRYGKCAKK
jgi:hypothetical protein